MSTDSPPRTAERPEAAILFQTFFKSGPRTYAAQVKQTASGDHFLVLTDGKRDPQTEEVRKSRLFVFSENFEAFFKLIGEAAGFIKANPVPPEVQEKRRQIFARRSNAGRPGAASSRGQERRPYERAAQPAATPDRH